MVSPLMLGTVEFGSKVEEVEARRIFDAAVDAGINLVDTANVPETSDRHPGLRPCGPDAR
jgi:aryl-alcohol dehydrogenase-like predicted oxidoreductase